MCNPKVYNYSSPIWIVWSCRAVTFSFQEEDKSTTLKPGWRVSLFKYMVPVFYLSILKFVHILGVERKPWPSPKAASTFLFPWIQLTAIYEEPGFQGLRI